MQKNVWVVARDYVNTAVKKATAMNAILERKKEVFCNVVPMCKINILTKTGVILFYETVESYQDLQVSMDGIGDEVFGRRSYQNYLEITDPKTNKKKLIQKRYIFLIEE